MSDNVIQMPGSVQMMTFTQIDGGKWLLTEVVLNDEQRYRRLVRTQIDIAICSLVSV